MFSDEISNEELRPEHVPGPDAPWQEIAEFALTFDGYEAMKGLSRLSRYAQRASERWGEDGWLPRDLLHLRSCLFMEQRAVRWAENGPFPSGPTAEQVAYAHALIEAIRAAAKETASLGSPDDDLVAREDDDDDKAFAPGELEVGALTSAQRQAIIDEGALLINDALWTRDEVLRWRRFMRVAYGWRQCAGCGLWTERKPGVDCGYCGLSPDDGSAPADFVIRTEGTISLLAPLTERARIWVDENISEHVEYAANVVIKQPDLNHVLTGIIDDGLSIV
jgi:hypothetical protein